MPTRKKISTPLSRSIALTLLIVSGLYGPAEAATWHVYKTKDTFTGTENIAAEATGLHGGGILVKCSEGRLHLFLEVPPTLVIMRKNHGLAKELMGRVSAHVPDYRFRVDKSGIYRPALGTWGLETIIHYHGNRFEDATLASLGALSPSTSANEIVSEFIVGDKLVYQIPPQTGPVYKMSLLGASEILLPLVHECVQQQKMLQRGAGPKGGQ